MAFVTRRSLDVTTLFISLQMFIVYFITWKDLFHWITKYDNPFHALILSFGRLQVFGFHGVNRGLVTGLLLSVFVQEGDLDLLFDVFISSVSFLNSFSAVSTCVVDASNFALYTAFCDSWEQTRFVWLVILLFASVKTATTELSWYLRDWISDICSFTWVCLISSEYFSLGWFSGAEVERHVITDWRLCSLNWVTSNFFRKIAIVSRFCLSVYKTILAYIPVVYSDTTTSSKARTEMQHSRRF